MNQTQDIYQFTLSNIDGIATSMAQFRGAVLLIVNTASRCGFTPQYRELEDLYQRYKARGFFVLGFPCNQFGGQEPGDETEIKGFCEVSFGVTFPLFAKVVVNGSETTALFKFLKAACPGVLGSTAIKWNFTKFLIDRAGKPIARFAPNTAPHAIAESIEQLLIS